MPAELRNKELIARALTAQGFASIIQTDDTNGVRSITWELWIHASKGPLIVYAQRPAGAKEYTVLDVYRPMTATSDIGVQLANIASYQGALPS